MARGTFKQKRGGGRKYVHLIKRLKLRQANNIFSFTVLGISFILLLNRGVCAFSDGILPSKHLELNEEGTAVAVDKWYALLVPGGG